jgi:Galactose oxidase, central domain
MGNKGSTALPPDESQSYGDSSVSSDSSSGEVVDYVKQPAGDGSEDDDDGDSSDSSYGEAITFRQVTLGGDNSYSFSDEVEESQEEEEEEKPEKHGAVFDWGVTERPEDQDEEAEEEKPAVGDDSAAAAAEKPAVEEETAPQEERVTKEAETTDDAKQSTETAVVAEDKPAAEGATEKPAEEAATTTDPATEEPTKEASEESPATQEPKEEEEAKPAAEAPAAETPAAEAPAAETPDETETSEPSKEEEGEAAAAQPEAAARPRPVKAVRQKQKKKHVADNFFTLRPAGNTKEARWRDVPLSGVLEPLHGHSMVWLAPSPDDGGGSKKSKFDSSNVLVFGGQTAEGVSDEVKLLDVTSGSVEFWGVPPGVNTLRGKAGVGPGPLTDHVAAWNAELQRMVVWGGRNEDGDVSGETWSFDPQSRDWSAVATHGAVPPGRCGTSTCWGARNAMFLFGGEDANGERSNELWKASTIQGEMIWTLQKVKGKKRPSPRAFASLSQVGSSGLLLLLGGATSSDEVMSDAWLFDPKKRRWTEIKGDFPMRPRCRHIAVELNGGVLVLDGEGRTEENNFPCAFNDAWAFMGEFHSTKKKQIKRITCVPYPIDDGEGPANRMGAAAVLIPADDDVGRRLVVCGGATLEKAAGERKVDERFGDLWTVGVDE